MFDIGDIKKDGQTDRHNMVLELATLWQLFHISISFLIEIIL